MLFRSVMREAHQETLCVEMTVIKPANQTMRALARVLIMQRVGFVDPLGVSNPHTGRNGDGEKDREREMKSHSKVLHNDFNLWLCYVKQQRDYQGWRIFSISHVLIQAVC